MVCLIYLLALGCCKSGEATSKRWNALGEFYIQFLRHEEKK